MKLNRTMALPLFLGGMLAASATAVQAADLEFYFPVGVNAPAVATIASQISPVCAATEIPPPDTADRI